LVEGIIEVPFFYCREGVVVRTRSGRPRWGVIIGVGFVERWVAKLNDGS
jgi:hypothetical protein